MLLGFKVAGVKVILPWTGVETCLNIEPNELLMPVYIALGYLASCYLLTKNHVRSKQNKAKQWNEKVLPELRKKYEVVCHMIAYKAWQNQAKSQVKVLLALYGMKSNIKTFIQPLI